MRPAHLLLPSLFLLGLFCVAPLTTAQADSETAAEATTETISAPPETTASPITPAVPKVIEVVSSIPGRPHEAGLGDRFTVTVENLSTALEEAGGCQQITLFLGGMPVPGITPERCDPDTGHVGFLLTRSRDASDTWSALLGHPDRFKRPVRLTVGAGPDRSYPTLIQPGGKEFRLVVLKKIHFLTFLVALVATLTPVVLLSQRTALLRRPSLLPPHQRPFSLARVQLAFWSILAAEAYLFVWLISDNLDSITESVLVLMGMGSATALGGSLIDSEDEPKDSSYKRHSRGFLADILSDASGINIQRFQLFTWTLILGLIFCVSVYRTLEMPEFSSTLLALMGISSGTYLAFKFPEKKTPAPVDPTAAKISPPSA